MNDHFYIAGAVLMALIGVIHTVLGEVLIFQRMRVKGLVPTRGGDVLRERNVRILWATWHLATVLGFLAAVMIVHLTRTPAASDESKLLVVSLIGAMLAGSLLVLVGTRGRHPGWAGLLVVALLVGAGAYA